MITKSKFQTQKFAAKLAKNILRSTPHGLRAKVIALSGDLGAGKTTFTQGFIKALGVMHNVTSPTFLIVRRYEIPTPYALQATRYHNVFHFDLYRIHSAKELSSLHFKKILNDPQNIVLIEWPEQIGLPGQGKAIPKSADWIYFEHGRNIKERKIVISK